MVLPKIHRLRRRQDFSRVYQAGTRHTTPHLVLKALRQEDKENENATGDLSLCASNQPTLNPIVSNQSASDQTAAQLTLAQPTRGQLVSEKGYPTRIGISISQKVSKRAVVRNRIKRQVRAALRQLLPQLTPGWMLAVIVRPNATECGYEQFLQELKQLLIKAEVVDGY